MKNRQKILLLGVLILISAKAVASTQPVFNNNAKEVTESGYIKLSWQFGDKSGDCVFELQQSENQIFNSNKILYMGPDYATFLSGLRNGNYFYRVRAVCGDEQAISDWSDTITVKVQHHSLMLAFGLFGVGAVIFLLTIGIVIQGARQAAATAEQ